MRLHPMHPKLHFGLSEFAVLFALLGSTLVLVLLVAIFATSAR